MAQRPPTILIIMDGISSTEPSPGNAVAMADCPFLYNAWNRYPRGLLQASAEYVGLPKAVKGNSEVGHTNIGAGQVVYQYLPRIDNTIARGLLNKNSEIVAFIAEAKKRGTPIHLMGCLSDGNVHASLPHWVAFMRLLAEEGVTNKVYIHAFTDGRDTPPQNARVYFEILDQTIAEFNLGQLASVVGRQIAMDRNMYWPRIQQAYDLLTAGKGAVAHSWREVLQESYAKNITDEFIEPHFIVGADNKPITIQDNDLVFFCNFRPDRAVELTTAFTEESFDGFARTVFLPNLYFMTMVRYKKELTKPHVVFQPLPVKVPIGRVISDAGLTQLRIAESQKYPHVTYFANGGTNTVFPGEHRINIPSRNDVTYDKIPEMSIQQVTDTVLQKIDENIYSFILLNFANGDMVGHTGVLESGIKAVQHVDRCVELVVKKILSKGGTAFITADHGNVDEMINLKTGVIDTEHSIFPVPLIVVQDKVPAKYLGVGQLADLAPTILNWMGLSVPSDMTGHKLL